MIDEGVGDIPKEYDHEREPAALGDGQQSSCQEEEQVEGCSIAELQEGVRKGERHNGMCIGDSDKLMGLALAIVIT